MAKDTLIEIVQDLLSDMDSDEVNSISDTVEADQVARIVRRVYRDMVEELDLPSNGDIITLEDAASVDLPTRLKLPVHTDLVEWIKYANIIQPDDEPLEKLYKNIRWKSPTDFINIVVSRSPSDTDNQVVAYSPESDILLPIRTNVAPNYWTSFDDEYIWFDSWDSTQTTTIVANHTLVFARTSTVFSLTDTFTPDLPANLFPYLYAKAKSLCFADIKQSPNQKAEQTENRLRIRTQSNKWRHRHTNNMGPNYGRK